MIDTGSRSSAIAVLSLLALAACSQPAAVAPAPSVGPVPVTVVPTVERRAGALPPVPARTGTLAIDVVYPTEGQTLAVRDSNFIFGSVGTGGATLTIDGIPVEVAANGAFLGFVPVPADGRYDLRATAAGTSVDYARTVRFPGSPATPAPPRDTTLPAPAPPLTPTVSAPRVAVAASSNPDRITVGTAVPSPGTPYLWAFPPSTRLTINGRQGAQYRARLTDQLSVWVDTAEVDVLPEGTSPPIGSISNVTATPQAGWVDVRLTTSDRFPFRVEVTERGLTVSVYGAETRTNITQYGATDPLIESLEWEVPSDELYQLKIALSEPLWGYLPFWDERGYLTVRIMRTPNIDPVNPLRGMFIAVDAGHPPGGAIGPTRLTEAEATLAVTRRIIPLLEQRGARVLDVRPNMEPISPGERVRATQASGANLFLSVHFDAFGDGTNPFRSYGTHVLFNQPHSLDFARAMQRELLLVFGLPDLGVRKQDVAVIRNPAMPTVLSETMFMMFPQQEAALRNPEALQAIAEAHVRGIEAFLRARAEEVRTR